MENGKTYNYLSPHIFTYFWLWQFWSSLGMNLTLMLAYTLEEKKTRRNHNMTSVNKQYYKEHYSHATVGQCCGEKSGRTRRGQPLMGNLLNRPSQRHVHFSIHGNSQWPQFCDNSLYLSISFSVYVAQTRSLIGACCLRTLLHPRHYLDRIHSDLNNMFFKQYVDRASRYNMWGRVKALLSHTCRGSRFLDLDDILASTLVEKDRLHLCLLF